LRKEGGWNVVGGGEGRRVTAKIGDDCVEGWGVSEMRSEKR